MQSNTYGTLNLISRDNFAIIKDGLKKGIPGHAQCVLKLQGQEEKTVVPPTTVRFDIIRPTKSTPPLALLSDRFINQFLHRILTEGLILVKRNRTAEVLGSTLNFGTSNLDFFEVIETPLQRSEGGVKNRDRDSTRPTEMDGRLFATQ
jgi:hypothetical protein